MKEMRKEVTLSKRMELFSVWKNKEKINFSQCKPFYCLLVNLRTCNSKERITLHSIGFFLSKETTLLLFFHAIEENLPIQLSATKENRFPVNKQHRPKSDDVINTE